ncbi:3418_t:CDS:2, partial [Entrophospora sp. SA101]
NFAMPPNVIDENVQEVNVFRREDVTKHYNIYKNKINNEQENPWYLIIDNKVYDVKDFIADHPGGAVILTHIGKDATDAFHNFHQKTTHELLANFYIGDLVKEDVITKKEGFTQELREIKEIFINKKYFESSKTYYALKVLSNLLILFTSLLILIKFSDKLLGVVISAAMLGVFWQQCGWLSHDFLHHQVFEDRRYNNLMGDFLGGVCQGFSPSWWKDKHNTHHAAPNVHSQDPDINTHPILTWSEYALFDLFDPEWQKENEQTLPPSIIRIMVKYQTLFYFPILTFARISWCFQSILFVLPGGQFNKQTKARMPISKSQQISLVIHYVWYSLFISIIDDFWLKVAYFITSQATCGLLLALVFALNHFGMKIISEEEAQDMDFFVEQIVTGRDIVARNPKFQWCVDWFCGGLNYQIEHHLFPRIPRHHFHKVQPIIRNLCEKYSIPYHRTTFLEGTKEVFNCLSQVSSKLE